MKKNISLMAGVLLAIIIVMSTGAFLSVEADRDADVTVANDAAALLSIYPEHYSELDENGPLHVNITRVNKNATSTFQDVFTITNDGTENVKVKLEWNNKKYNFVIENRKNSSSWEDVGNFDSGETEYVDLRPGKTVWVSVGVMTKLSDTGCKLHISAVPI